MRSMGQEHAEAESHQSTLLSELFFQEKTKDHKGLHEARRRNYLERCQGGSGK